MAREWQDEDVLHELYVEQDLSYDEICERLGCSKGTLSKWMDRHDIEGKRRFTTGGEWTDEDTLRELYHDKRMSLREISDELDCAEATLGRWMDKHGIERRQSMKEISGPWQDKEVLQELYEERGLSLKDIADRYGIVFQTVRRWVHIHDLDVRRRGGEVEPIAGVCTNQRGYVRCRTRDGSVYIHRLVALREHDPEELDGNHVHHKNGIPWDNRPGNLEVVTPEKHGQIHNEQ